MEISGRECKEVKIGEHTYWFIEKFKGGDVRKIMAEVIGQSKDGSVFDEKSIITKIPEIFMLLCLRIDEDTEPTIEYVDELGVNEYIKVQNVLMEEVKDLFTEVK